MFVASPWCIAAEAIAILALALAVWTTPQCLHTPAPIVTAVLLTAVAVLDAWGYRSPECTYIASAIVLLCSCQTLVANYPGLVTRPWILALLAHATLAMFAGPVLMMIVGRRLLRACEKMGTGSAAPSVEPRESCHSEAPVAIASQALRTVADDLRRVFVEPLGATALVTSALVLPVLLAFPGGKAIDLAGDLSWLAMIWLVVACTRGWPVLLSAAQVVLASATVAATTAWLGEHPWNPAASGGSGIDLADPRTLQVYGIGLGLFSLAWAVVRLVLRRNAYARELLSWDKWEALPAATTTATVRGDCPNSRDEDDARNVVRRSALQFTTRSVVPHSVDWLVAWAVVAGQLFLGAGLAFLACAHELTLAGPVGNAQRVAFGPAAWGLVGVLALVVLARLWTRWRNADLVFCASGRGHPPVSRCRALCRRACRGFRSSLVTLLFLRCPGGGDRVPATV